MMDFLDWSQHAGMKSMAAFLFEGSPFDKAMNIFF